MLKSFNLVFFVSIIFMILLIPLDIFSLMLSFDSENQFLVIMNVLLILIGFFLSLVILYGYYLISNLISSNSFKKLLFLVILVSFLSLSFNLFMLLSVKTSFLIKLNYFVLIINGIIQVIFGYTLFKLSNDISSLTKYVGFFYIINGFFFYLLF